jgi:vanillate O-demethylase ferredoxin subunit
MIEVQVAARHDEALDICSYELTPVDGQALPAFTAGAHIDVHLPDGLIRQYSLCNHPEERHRYLIGVLKDPASRGGSRSLHEQIRPGMRLLISEPRNLFTLAAEARRSLLFAGGIGITPRCRICPALLRPVQGSRRFRRTLAAIALCRPGFPALR